MTMKDYNRAITYLSAHNFRKAIPFLEKCYNNLKDSPSYSAFCANQLALIYDKGLGTVKKKDLKAIEFYKKAYLIDKTEVNIFNYANALIKLGFYEDSLDVLNDCLDADATREYKSWCSNQLGLIHEHKKCKDSSLKEAIHYYKLAYEYNKSDFYNIYNLAMIYKKANKVNEAEPIITECAAYKQKEYIIYTDHCKDLLKEYLELEGESLTPKFIEINRLGEVDSKEIEL